MHIVVTLTVFRAALEIHDFVSSCMHAIERGVIMMVVKFGAGGILIVCGLVGLIDVWPMWMSGRCDDVVYCSGVWLLDVWSPYSYTAVYLVLCLIGVLVCCCGKRTKGVVRTRRTYARDEGRG